MQPFAIFHLLITALGQGLSLFARSMLIGAGLLRWTFLAAPGACLVLARYFSASIIARAGLSAFLVLASCMPAGAGEIAAPFSASAFEPVAKEKAILLVSVNWNRRWRCGAYENAQLRSLGFDRAGAEKASADRPDVLIEGGALFGKKGFTDYALMVEPGDYQMSSFSIKVAKSVSDVGYLTAGRATLISDGKSKAGSFSVHAGETVYIGHFFVDCAQEPIPWRFYPEDEGDFTEYLKLVARDFPGVPTEQAKFRLFDTTTMGNPRPSSRR